MVIIAILYIILVWLLFWQFKVLKWGWLSGTTTVILGVLILAVFMALFNHLTPAGRFVVISRVVEITPNVAGQVTAIPVQANAPVKAGATLLQIDPAPFQTKVDQLRASLAGAEQQAKQLKANHEQAIANVSALKQQLTYQTRRLEDVKKLASSGAQAEFRLQDTQIQYDLVRFQLEGAEAAELNARLAAQAEIGGVNTSVAQIIAQLEQAVWELQQTTVRAPSDGYVTAMTLAVGSRTAPTRSAISFVVSSDLTIVGMFRPNAFQTVKTGSNVKMVFDNYPGRIFEAKIADVPRGVGEGQIAVSGVMARSGTLSGAVVYPAVISLPADYRPDQLRLGMPGSAWAFADNAGAIGAIMSVLVWVSSYTAYL